MYSQRSLDSVIESSKHWVGAFWTGDSSINGRPVPLESAIKTLQAVEEVRAGMQEREKKGYPPVLGFSLIGRWDDFRDMDSPVKLLDYLHEIAGNSYRVNDLKKPADAVGNLADDQGNPFENFGDLQRMYVPLSLPVGTYVIRGIDTAAESYPQQDEVALDKQGNPLTVEVVKDMSPFDIMIAVTTCADAAYDGFPHHCYFESLDIDTAEKTFTFGMGS